jgi:hypothetical protein
MDDYLLKHPGEKENIMVLSYALGNDKAEHLCRQALKENKRIRVVNDFILLDKVYYSLVDFE